MEKKGLVEKEITTPYNFIATPVECGLQILLSLRLEQYRDVQERTKAILQKFQEDKQKTPQKHEYKLIEINGRPRLMQRIKLQHDNAQRNVDILSTLARWLQILDFAIGNYEKALARGVKYRVVIEAPSSEIIPREKIQALMTKPNFKLKLSRDPLKTNSAIFDQREITVNFSPSESLANSPMIWTDHPSFISMCQDHFNVLWKSARDYKPENKK